MSEAFAVEDTGGGCGCPLVEADFFGLKTVVPRCWCHPDEPCPNPLPTLSDRLRARVAPARRPKARRS